MNLMKKKLNKKGFTLAELLIVVAIIAVLTAIAIPVFTSQLNNAKIQTDHANIRGAYAQMRVYELESTSKAGTYYYKNDGSLETTTDDILELQGTESGNCTLGVYGTTGHTAGNVIKVVITYSAEGGNVGTLTLEAAPAGTP